MKNRFKTLNEHLEGFGDKLKNGTPEEQASMMQEAMNYLASDVRSEIMNDVQKDMIDQQVKMSRGQDVLTNEEREFFNAVIEEGGFKEKDTLPVTTQERVFEDLQEEHPLLGELGIQNMGAVTEFIYGSPEGAAVWGPLFGDIKGKLNANFRKEKLDQLKLTAFIPLAKDMLQLGPEWVERYVRRMIREAMAAGLERGYVEGDGNDQPIGLLYEREDNGAVVPKESSGTLTFAAGEEMIDEMAKIIGELSVYQDADGNDKVRSVDNRIVMVTNPIESHRVAAKATIQNANGAYVTNYPFNFKHTESVYVPQGQALFFVRGEYIAAVGGNMEMNRYNEVLAMEDASLFIAKQFATGKPKDKNAAKVFDLVFEEEATEA